MQTTIPAPDDENQAARSYPHPFQGAGHTQARQVPVLLHRARDAMATRMRSIFDPYNLTDPQWRVLRLLSIADEIDAADLAARAFLLGPSLSRIVRDLSERGLLMRRASEGDARRYLHSITPAGMELVREIVPQFDPLYERIERELGIKDLRRLNTTMERLVEILSAMP